MSELMICANAEKCGDRCDQMYHRGVHDHTVGCVSTCNRGGAVPPATCIPYKPTKDTTMTVSYQDLKEKGACEKGLIWFGERFGNERRGIDNVKDIIREDRDKIRGIYHADPDSWIKWLEEKYPEELHPRIIDNIQIQRRICHITIECKLTPGVCYDIKSFAEWLYKETR